MKGINFRRVLNQAIFEKNHLFFKKNKKKLKKRVQKRSVWFFIRRWEAIKTNL